MITFAVEKRRVRLSKCPPGLFLFNGAVCCKTEYKTQNSRGEWQSDAYVVASGEYFWGGVSDARRREQMLVHPMLLVDLGNDTP